MPDRNPTKVFIFGGLEGRQSTEIHCSLKLCLSMYQEKGQDYIPLRLITFRIFSLYIGFNTFGLFSKYAERLMNTQKEICI